MLPEKELEQKMAIAIVRTLKEKKGDELVKLVSLFMQKYDMTASIININKIPKS